MMAPQVVLQAEKAFKDKEHGGTKLTPTTPQLYPEPAEGSMPPSMTSAEPASAPSSESPPRNSTSVEAPNEAQGHWWDDLDAHVPPAVHGFFKSIALGSEKSLQDILRLLTLWFKYGHREKVEAALTEGFDSVSIETWLQVIPQIIARIHMNNTKVRNQISDLLSKVPGDHDAYSPCVHLGSRLVSCSLLCLFPLSGSLVWTPCVVPFSHPLVWSPRLIPLSHPLGLLRPEKNGVC